MKATILSLRVEWDDEDAEACDHPKDWIVRQIERDFGDDLGLFVQVENHADVEPISDEKEG